MTRGHDPQYRPAPDPYAHARCACDHLTYPDQPDACRWCDCRDHKPQEAR